MKNLFKKSSIACLLLTATMAAQAQFAGGTGISGDPYIITDATQLDEVRNGLTAYYRLDNDIDLADYLSSTGAGYNGGAGWQPIGINFSRFSGNFNGGGHKITGLWINRSGTSNVGLFGYIEGATIDSLGVEIAAAGVIGNNNVGGLVGSQFDAIISNCYVAGNVSGNYAIGGLAGWIDNSNISKCYATGSVSGNSAVGGLVGVQNIDNATSNSTAIANCYASGNVSGSSSIGGLIGTQTITGVGNNHSITATNCYASGSVSGSSNVGGLIGQQENTTMSGSNSISTAGCFFDNQTTGQSNGVGNINNSFGGTITNNVTGKTTAEMYAGATFTGAGWDFTAIWGIYEGFRYPFFQWQEVNIISANSTTVVSGAGGTFQVTATGTAPIVYSLSGEPAGVSINSTSGLITIAGTTAAGIHTFTVTASNGITPDTSQSFTLTVTVAPPQVVGPRITGSASMTLTEGYEATTTDAFIITGTMPVTVVKTSGDERITWDNMAKKLDIAEGLPVGVYPVVLTASNNVGSFRFTFTLTVEKRVYYIDNPVVAGGTVTVQTATTNPYIAEEGETVTLTITPDDGYELASILTVDYYNSNVIVPLNCTGNTCTFMMPTHHIRIVVVFKPITTGNEQWTIDNGQFKAWVQNGTLYVSGVTNSATLRVYNIFGILIASSNLSEGGEVALPLPGSGLYIVSDGKNVVKMVN